jgi:hypothetical protein
MHSACIEGDEWGTYVALVTSASPERGIAYGTRVCAVSRTVCIPGAAGRNLEGSFWVNGLPGVERQKGQQHAAKAVIN